MREWMKRKLETGAMTYITDGYLYSMQTGVLTVRQGSVYCRHDISRHANLCDFYTDVDTCKKLLIEPEAGVIHNKAMWLPERDDAKAIDIFTEYENAQIAKLQNEINMHKHRIELMSAVYSM